MKINDYFNSKNIETLYESKDYLETKRRLEYFLDEEDLAFPAKELHFFNVVNMETKNTMLI